MAADRPCFPTSIHLSTPNAIRMNRALRMSRRDMLLGAMGAAAVVLGAGRGVAASPEGEDAGVAPFLELSRRLTDRDVLDARIGSALYARIIQAVPERRDQIQKLHDLMAGGKFDSARALATAAEHSDPVFKDVIHDIMTGWYRGVADEKVVVYRSALMFDITKDAIYPKTYAAGGPFYWTQTPPEVAVPTGEPALSPSKFVVEPT
ncbi:sorbitol dehydrogenase family protein [Komagataeibacter intermedius]|uniref:Sorbitol dehydrogenase n=2 Tax=Komagataeibacter intermedius TaxID=66229 RepID=A0A0N0ME93_9PROT|nr:sorbitol dehydrogenase family protein [Komagataeibacter intermedius]KPH86216.1 sorbitol dehydrogenase [Komagataeibacter intermedius AF2]MCF3635264.1 sorbitol dehydrogenase family protein [Komagataeibacter intermedius]GAN87305.1 sorbitol dehydrogenase small subunit [Komagataeibacter intermedius TF2]GBQ69913.1 sorbitol dehydrogenase small subunit [Komagataeibacter intermedius NRIC 0521]